MPIEVQWKFADSAVSVRSKYCRSSVILLPHAPWKFADKQTVYLGKVRWVRSQFGFGAVRVRFARVLVWCSALTFYCSLLYCAFSPAFFCVKVHKLHNKCSKCTVHEKTTLKLSCSLCVRPCHLCVCHNCTIFNRELNHSCSRCPPPLKLNIHGDSVFVPSYCHPSFTIMKRFSE